MRINIRVIIAGLFALLLVLVSSCIIILNYYAMNQLLIGSSRDMLHKTGTLIEGEIATYFGNVQVQTENGARFLEKNVIGLQQPEELKKYLIHLVINYPAIYGAYVSNPAGSFYSVRKAADPSKLLLLIINRDIQPFYQVDGVMDNYGNIISSIKTFDIQYDPRLRPWYKEVVTAHNFDWSPIYKFAKEERDVYGITASKPVYDQKGELQNVFSIDTTVNIFSSYIAKLAITPNTFIYIMDSDNNIITANKIIINGLNSLTIPWVKYSLELFNKGQKNATFQFKFEGKWYVAKYEKLLDIFGNSATIGIVFPQKDIVGPLKTNLYNLFFVTVFLLFLGLLFTRILGRKISRPIVALANDAKEIAKMNISKDSGLKSWITEVLDMTAAFNLMKHALRSFVRYVPFNLVKQLVQSGEIAKVGGKSKDVTLLFVDVQGFTALSEPMQPPALMEFLSEFFDGMSKTILKFNGTIDKYIGDGIMAFWGAPIDDPQHAANACRCALEMLPALSKINQLWLKEGKPQVRIRIGINSANVVVGNVGSEDRLSYTVMGDGVNLASRIEELNKIYHTTILVGESTYEQVKELVSEFSFRLIDDIAVRGKKLGGKVYELLNAEVVANVFGNNLAEYNAEFIEAFQLYQQGKWDEAQTKFDKLHDKYPQDGLLAFYKARINLLRERHPHAWRGVWEQDHG